MSDLDPCVPVHELESFILAHENDDITQLLLTKDKYVGIDIPLVANTLQTRKKLREKVPSFYHCPSLIYPTRLSGEQCSSEETALYKAELAHRHCPNFRLADLSGGLGVDSWAFAQKGQEILHNEQNEELSQAVQGNFQKLGITNCRFARHRLISQEEMDSRSTEEQNSDISRGLSARDILRDFSADILFLDPARRDDKGGKVFRLEDCSPRILQLKNELFEHARYLFLKLSPMADIHSVCEKLGEHCQHVYIVGSQHECKELLIWMDREYAGGYDITVKESQGEFHFTPEAEKEAIATKADTQEELDEIRYLFEPGKALMKSGAFKLLSQRFGLKKMADSTHLYFGSPEQMPVDFGKCYRVEKSLPFSSRSIKELVKEYPNADVTARNLPITSDELKKRMKVKGKSTQQYHLFALGCETQRGEKENRVFVCQKIEILPK